jgi:CheY-like chemotaxis protein
MLVTPSGTGNPAGSRILLVEDEAMVRMMLADMLAQLGHQVVAEASRLDTARGMAANADYDLAVLDLNLGAGPTYEVVDIVRERRKAMIVSTGYGEPGLGSRYPGAVVLQKPFSSEAIRRAIEQSLQQLAPQNGQSATG